MTKDVLNQNKPDWLELPEEEKQSHTYWVCYGTEPKQKKKINWLFWKKKKPSKELWITIFHDKEESELDAYLHKVSNFIWDGEHAQQITLDHAMFRARARGIAGVEICGFKNGKLVCLKKYPSSVLLPKD
jgi:hypothetical protein